MNEPTLHIVEANKLPPQIMLLFGCERNEAFAYAAKWHEPVYYVEASHSYYVVAHYDQKVTA